MDNPAFREDESRSPPFNHSVHVRRAQLISRKSLILHAQFALNRPNPAKKNIAIGTTEPEIDSVTWIKFDNNMVPLALDVNLTTRWRHSPYL